MLVLLSPAKTLDFSEIKGKFDFSIPEFINEADKLVQILRKLDSLDLSALMGISAKLADLNFGRLLKWDKNHTSQNSKQSVFAFNGDVYEGLDVSSIPKDNIDFLNKNVRILSGLYGILKPSDIIHEYRLEMGTKLKNSKGKDLYHFWDNKIVQSTNKAIKESDGEKVLINLASNEYFKAIDPKILKYPVISPVFKDYKDDGFQFISFFAKKARGMMTRFIALEKIDNSEQLKLFKFGGYSYNDQLTSGNQWVFTR